MEFFFQLLMQGVVIGLVYALIGQGLNVTFWTIGVVNFAHGALMMVTVFAALSVYGAGLPVGVAMVSALIFAGTLGMVLERVAVRPVIKRPGGLGWIVATIGAAIVIQEIAGAIYGPQARAALPIIFEATDFLRIGEVGLSMQLLLAAGIAACILLAFHIILRYTAWGSTLRAVSFDRDLATLQGVHTQRVVAISFFISAALAGVAGLLLAPVTGISPSFGFALMLSGFAAIVVGGVGSPVGAIVGGLVVGVTELLVGGYIGSSSQRAVAFVILVVILMFRPTGLFGESRMVKL